MEEFMNDVIKALKMKLGEGYRIFPKEQKKIMNLSYMASVSIRRMSP